MFVKISFFLYNEYKEERKRLIPFNRYITAIPICSHYGSLYPAMKKIIKHPSNVPTFAEIVAQR
jgi:hypothetical protein